MGGGSPMAAALPSGTRTKREISASIIAQRTSTVTRSLRRQTITVYGQDYDSRLQKTDERFTLTMEQAHLTRRGETARVLVVTPDAELLHSADRSGGGPDSPFANDIRSRSLVYRERSGYAGMIFPTSRSARRFSTTAKSRTRRRFTAYRRRNGCSR